MDTGNVGSRGLSGRGVQEFRHQGDERGARVPRGAGLDLSSDEQQLLEWTGHCTHSPALTLQQHTTPARVPRAAFTLGRVSLWRQLV